jgi:hypothetical protein
MADSFTYPLLPQSPCLTEEQLLAYIDGKMSAAEQHEAELHITDCALCSDAVDGWQLVKDRDKALAFPAEVTMAAASAQPEVKSEPKVIPLQSNRRLWLSIAASVAVILVIAATITIIVPDKDKQLAENTAAKKPGSPEQPLPAPPADQSAPLTDSQTEAAKLPQTIIEVGTTTYYSKEEVAEADMNYITSEEIPAPERNSPMVTEDAMTMSEILAATEDSKFQEKALAKDEAKSDQAERDRQSAPGAMADSAVILANTTSVSTGSTTTTTWNVNAQQEQLSDVVVAEKSTPKKSTVTKNKQRAQASQPSAAGASVALHPSYSLGMQYMQQKKYNEAIAEFDKVLAVKTNFSYADAQWQKALALIKLGKKAEAKTLLQEIVNAKGPYKTQAEAELKKL